MKHLNLHVGKINYIKTKTETNNDLFQLEFLNKQDPKQNLYLEILLDPLWNYTQISNYIDRILFLWSVRCNQFIGSEGVIGDQK